ncbi:MAG: molybdopterin-dependent oxidoreductase [Nitrososphaeria archaeon]|jgi:DMSO/TMAO reductase YedYZ molybdopterin-dependent catalytic subunit
MRKVSKTKGMIKPKFITIAVIAIIVVAAIVIGAVAVWQLSSSPSNKKNTATTLPSMNLTLIGATGNQIILHSSDIAKLTTYSGYGGYKSSGGMLGGFGNYTGVPLVTLLNLVGGITTNQTVTITGSDGYSMVYTYQQVNGQGYIAYDPVTGSESSVTRPLTVILAYYYNSTTLTSDVGPLRLVILGPQSLLTEGHFWTKLVDKIEVTQSVENWNLVVNGTTPLNMDMQAYTADINHFPQNYTDNTGNVWTGVALDQFVSYSAINGGISNASLAKGYVVKVIGGDGYFAIMNDTFVNNNNNIIVAAKLNGAILPSPYWPLTLVGSDLTMKQMVKDIVQIQIMPIPHMNLTIVGSNGTQIVLHSQDIASFSSYTAAGGFKGKGGIQGVGNYTGVPILTLLNLVGGITTNQNVTITGSDGYSMVYTYQQLNGQGLNTYDPTTGNPTSATQSMTMIVAYYRNGAALPSGGPLTIAIVGPQGLLTDGNKWASMTEKIQVNP